MHHLIHENELSQHPELAECVQAIDAQHPPVGYERMLYPYLFIVPGQPHYLRLIKDDSNQLLIPLYVTDAAMYQELVQCSNALNYQLLVLDQYRDWLDTGQTRLIPLGAWQDIDIHQFTTRGNKMRKLRYLVEKFKKLGAVETVEYSSSFPGDFDEMKAIMTGWSAGKKNVIQHSFVCMKELLEHTLPASHRAFFTYCNQKLCSVIVIETSGEGSYVMDQEFYDPATAPLGHMEYGIVEIIERLKQEGASTFSLGVTWYPFPFEQYPKNDPDGWEWVVQTTARKTLLSRIFEQGKTNYQFKKKFGVVGDPIFIYLPQDAPFSTLLHYWPVFFQNSQTAEQVTTQLQQIPRPQTLSAPAPQTPTLPVAPPQPEASKSARSQPQPEASKSARSQPEASERPKLLHREDREAMLGETEKLELLNYSDHPLDLMTDSWFGIRSDAVLQRTAYLNEKSVSPSMEALHALFPFKHIILTGRGGDAEALFYGVFPKTKSQIITAIPWLSTLMHQLNNGFEVIEILNPGVMDPQSEWLFKGEMDLDALTHHLEQSPQTIGMVGLEVLSNGTGGHPVRLSHLRAVKEKLQSLAIPLVLDASRIVRNAFLVKQHEDGYQDTDVWTIVQRTLAQADHVVMSLTKDFAVPVGGLVATNDDALAAAIKAAQTVQDPAVPFNPDVIGYALSERDTIQDLVSRQMAFTRRVQDQLKAAGVPILQPAYGHAVVVDVSQLASGATSAQKKENFLKTLFLETGIRAGAHLAGKQKNTRLDRCVRFAIPLGLTPEHEEAIVHQLQTFFVATVTRSVRKSTKQPSGAQNVPRKKAKVVNKVVANPEALIQVLSESQKQRLIAEYRVNMDRVNTDRMNMDRVNTDHVNGVADRMNRGTARANGGAGRGVTKSALTQDIAIVGLSGKYPHAEGHYDFWEKLLHGENFIQAVPAERWDHRRYYDPALDQPFVPHKTRCNFGAFLSAHDTFDAPFFDMTRDEVLMMDPQERLALETAWACIEDAGYVPAKLGNAVGLFTGVTYNEFQKLIPSPSHSCMINSRIAYFFDFQGPSISVDTGCASSLTAIDLACRSLNQGECQTALVTGANLILHPDHYVGLSSLLSTTREPCSKPFGNDDGWIPAEGVISILLKPLEQAINDRDHVYAVIKSSHIGQEGKTSWFTAFNPRHHADFLRDHFKKSGIHPETLSYVEMAANGSPMGDAVELKGMTTAFQQFTKKQGFCPMGSVKSNVGHGEAVSTMLQLTKVLLQLKSETLFPLAHTDSINPRLDIESSPFYFLESPQVWEPPQIQLNGTRFALPRRASISSFGGGGNMGHLILEEHQVEPISESGVSKSGVSESGVSESGVSESGVSGLNTYYLPLSAKTPPQLKQTVQNLLHFLESVPVFYAHWETHYTLLNIMYTLCVGRVAFPERIVFVAKDRDGFMHQLRQYSEGQSHPDILTPTESWHAVAQAWLRGTDVSWESFFAAKSVRRVSLPSYCFDPQSFPLPQPADPMQNEPLRMQNELPRMQNEPLRMQDEPPRMQDEAHQRQNVEPPKEQPMSHSKPAEGNREPVELKPEPTEEQSASSTHPVPPIHSDAPITALFKNIFSQAIHIPADQIDLLQPLDLMGFDSNLVTFVAHELETHFPKVPHTLFFECRTIQEVIDYFVDAYPAEVSILGEAMPKVSSTEPSRQPVSKTHKPVADGSIEELTKAILSNQISEEGLLDRLG